MALMTDERRKEMEEEMNRFELEIAVPGEEDGSPPISEVPPSKPLSPPPALPPVSKLIPKILSKPPPPPPSSSPPTSLLRPPPPPALQPPPRFVPAQVQRQPRPSPRPHFMGMRGPPRSFPPMGPRFGPPRDGPMHPMDGPPMHPMDDPMHPMNDPMHPMNDPMHPMNDPNHPMNDPNHPMNDPNHPMNDPNHPMNDPMHPMNGPPMHPMDGPMHPMDGPIHPMDRPIHPMDGPMHPMDGPPMHPHGPMMPGPMPMPPMQHPMNMGMGPPMPPVFCPPGTPMGHQGNMRFEPHFDSGDPNQAHNMEPPTSDPSNGNSSVVASAPTIYAAPFKKTHTDAIPQTVQTTVRETTTGSASLPVTVRSEKVPVPKPSYEASVGPTMTQEPVVSSKKKEKKKKIVRMAGGQAWEDNSLLEWETDDFRIFCGDLGNDVTDEVLIRAFSKYPSFVKAKVVRDKRTNKTKGFGFVSFKDPQDFIKAMREMNGRYVGSRPIKLRKSTWRDRNMDIVKKKQREKEKLGLL